MKDAVLTWKTSKGLCSIKQSEMSATEWDSATHQIIASGAPIWMSCESSHESDKPIAKRGIAARTMLCVGSWLCRTARRMG